MKTRTTLNKTDSILSELLNGAVMTHYKAMAYGTYRLADVAYRLRKRGYNIQTRETEDITGTRYTEYFIPECIAPRTAA